MSAATIVHDDPYCRIERRNSNRTILAFSAINCPPGKFHGSRALQDIDCNVVFINCPRNSWYLDGIPGLGGNIEESIEGLRNLLRVYGLIDGRLAAWGGSMGGYGAVLFGSRLDVDVIVATGAELELFVPGGNSELVLKTFQKRKCVTGPDMESIMASSQARISLYAGEFFYPDLVSALHVANRPNTRITTLRDFGHPLPGYLNSCYGLANFILHHFDSDEPFPFTNDEVGCLGEFTEHWNTLHRVSLGWQQAEVDRLMDLSRTSSNAEFRMHCHHALSMGATADGTHKRAVDQARLAVKAVPQSCFAAYRFTLALKNAGRTADSWLKVAMAIPHINEPDRFSDAERLLRVMVPGFLEAGWSSRGIQFLRQLMMKPETGMTARRLLQELIDELSGRQAWRASFDTQALSVLSGSLLDHPSVLERNGHLHVTGVMLFPSKEEPDSYEADGLDIKSIETGLASPGFGKRFPDHPSAGMARFRLNLCVGKHDTPLVSAHWRDGRSMPIIRFKRVCPDNMACQPETNPS